MSGNVTASIVLYHQCPEDVTPLFEELAKDAALLAWVVVDNGGSVDACNLAESMGARCLRPGRNLGYGASHNLAMRSLVDCASPYHLVLNPDIRLGSGILAQLAKMMDAMPEVGLVMPQILYPDGTEQRLCKQIPTPLDLISRRFLGRFGRALFANQLVRYELRRLDMRIAREIPCLSGCFMFIRSAALREVGYFDERYFMYMEDVDLCRRIGAKYKTVFYPEVAVTHGYTKGSYRDPMLLKYHLQSAFKYFSKWGWIFDSGRDRLNRKAISLDPQ